MSREPAMSGEPKAEDIDAEDIDAEEVDAEEVDSTVDRLSRALRPVDRGHLVVITGAGISVASGIPTFRGSDPDAIWQKDITELGTFRYFLHDPVGSWSWYLSRFNQVLDAQPNAAHHALVELEAWQLERQGRFTLITQNVDTLHEAAGQRELVKVHGSADRIRCPRQGCANGAPDGSLPRSAFDVEAFLAQPEAARLPRCPLCGDILRQHVLWFDEYYGEHRDYQWSRVQEAAWSADLMLFVGTSFSVGVTELFLRQGLGRGIPQLSLDPSGAPSPVPRLEVLSAKAEVLLPAVVRQLRHRPQP